MVTGILAEDVDDYVSEIHENPLGRCLPFDAQGAGA
jgi:hypothetical protein